MPEVPIDRWVSWSSTQPDPTVAACRSGIPVTTCAAGEMPSSAATSACTGSDHGAGRHQRRQLHRVDAGHPDQLLVVRHQVEPAGVGEPGGRHRHVGGRGHAGEAHREVVHRLEVPARAGGDPGLVPVEVQHVADRVVARRRGDTAGVTDPGGERAGGCSPGRARRRRRGSAALPGCPSTSGTAPPGGRRHRRARCWPTARSRTPRRPGRVRVAPRRLRAGLRRRRAATSRRRPGWRRHRVRTSWGRRGAPTR